MIWDWPVKNFANMNLLNASLLVIMIICACHHATVMKLPVEIVSFRMEGDRVVREALMCSDPRE